MRNRTTFELAARLGYAARGVVYLIIGAFAVVAALSSGDRPTGKKGALQALLDEPFGEVLLGIVASGSLASRSGGCFRRSWMSIITAASLRRLSAGRLMW